MTLLLRSLLPLSLIFLSACSSYSPLTDKGGGDPERAADGSPSPVSREQAWKIARVMVTEREGWSDYQPSAEGPIHIVSYSSQRINHGAWRVVAHKGVTGSSHRYIGYDSEPPVILILNKQGSVIHYARRHEGNAAGSRRPIPRSRIHML